MGKKKIDLNIKASPEAEEAMAHFRPRFGSEEDLRIIELWEKIKNTLTLMENNDLRRREMEKMVLDNTTRMKQIKDKEKQLLWLIQNRKL